MSLSENMKSAAKFAGCEKEINTLEGIIQYLNKNQVKNIAVLGETNCGKTTLINKLSGTEVRKPTKLSLGEEPLKVVFGSEEQEEGYETVNVKNNTLSEMGIAFYEIPINMAIDYESKLATGMLEKMDAVFYVISAITPFTASDAANIGALANKYPLMIYISKSEMFENDAEYKETVEYIKNEFTFRFDGVFFEFFDGKDADVEQKILALLNDMEVDEIRKNHITQIEQRAKNHISILLQQKLDELEKEKKTKEQEVLAAEDTLRQEQLEWNEVRLAMMEKEQEVIDYVDKKISIAKIAAKQDLMAKMDNASSLKKWVKEEYKSLLQAKLEVASKSVLDDAADIVNMHAAWLVAEVNRRFNQHLVIKDMQTGGTMTSSQNEKCGEKYDYTYIVLATEFGLAAGYTIFSSIPLIPTCIVAIPASLLTAVLIKGSVDEYKKYRKAVKKFVDSSCEKNFANLTKQLHKVIHKYYEDKIEQVRELSNASEINVDFGNIKEREAKIKDMLYKLS